MTIAAELLIFSARAPTHFMLFLAPGKYLVASVLSGCILVCILSSNLHYFGKIAGRDIVLIWIYNIMCLFVVDYVKVQLFLFMDENLETLSDPAPLRMSPRQRSVVMTGINDTLPAEEGMSFRESAIAERMTEETIETNERLSQMERRPPGTSSRDSRGRSSSSTRLSNTERVSVTARGRHSTQDRGSVGMRGSFVNLGGSLRPVTPASRATGRL